MQNCIGGWERESINRNIVECKESIPADRIWVRDSINRNIVECKGAYQTLLPEPRLLY